jgi:hypothetical protein
LVVAGLYRRAHGRLSKCPAPVPVFSGFRVACSKQYWPLLHPTGVRSWVSSQTPACSRRQGPDQVSRGAVQRAAQDGHAGRALQSAAPSARHWPPMSRARPTRRLWATPISPSWTLWWWSQWSQARQNAVIAPGSHLELTGQFGPVGMASACLRPRRLLLDESLYSRPCLNQVQSGESVG